MGQAKRRGTFEQRQAEGIAKKQEQEHELAEARAAYRAKQLEREALKTPEERRRSRETGMVTAFILGATEGLKI